MSAATTSMASSSAMMKKEAPRLTNMLRSMQFASESVKSAEEERKQSYSRLTKWMEAKREQAKQDQNETNALSWQYIYAEITRNAKGKVFKIPATELSNGKSYVQHLIRAVENVVDKSSEDFISMANVIPVVAKQFYKIAQQERAKGRIVKLEKISEEMKKIFGEPTEQKPMSPSIVESILRLARKLADWVESVKVVKAPAEAEKPSTTKKLTEEEEENLDSDKFIYIRQVDTEHGFELDFVESAIDIERFQKRAKRLINPVAAKQKAEEARKREEAAIKKKQEQMHEQYTKQHSGEYIEEETPQSKQVVSSSVNVGSASSSKYNMLWLREECKKAVKSADVANNVVDALEKHGSNEGELQNALFELLGFEAFDLMAEIIANRNDLILSRKYTSLGIKEGKQERVIQSFSIQSEEEKAARKQHRKEANKNNKPKETQEQDGEQQASWLLQEGFKKWKQQRRQQALEDQMRDDSSVVELRDEDPQHILRALPEDCGYRRISGNGFEEYQIDPPKVAPINREELVPITEFEEWARIPFKGITHLNRVQSKVFPAAYRSNENLLICAPTGCGKTNVALMTMLREIGQHFKGGALRTEEFKIIYVAPMKALAQEMVENFSKRLGALGIVVKEMTGDMQLTKKEVQNTQLIITTPEKWDVITRKSSDMSLIQTVRLLIIDEVHLLHEDRGPVIECLVARTLRQVETSQSMIRIVGLSATLPNYADVAEFLRVNPEKGLFHFDNTYRPVPLSQTYIGVNVSNLMRRLQLYNDICYDKVVHSLKEGHQVMVFVHARKETVKTGQMLVDQSIAKNTLKWFATENEIPGWVQQGVKKSQNKELRELFKYGISFHHAGMLRSDRNLVEELFSKGYIRVLCCTATLAWGVNLPAHTVVIKGTEVYEPKKGTQVELGMLDVMQIFGRAGRPQFDTSGEGIIITSGRELPRYLRLLNHAMPIESKLKDQLVNHLNAEVVLGTVTNISEAVQWISYTYLFIRLRKNPYIYGVDWDQYERDPQLVAFRREIVDQAAKILDQSRMCRYHIESGTISPTDLGRIASHYYIDYQTIQMFNKMLRPNLTEEEVLAVLSNSHEFNALKVREEELEELKGFAEDCPVKVKGVETPAGKVNVLIQSFISQSSIKNFALVSDSAYVVQNVGRIVRAMFELVLRKGWPGLIDKLLTLNKCIERRMWSYSTPLRQFPLSNDILNTIEAKKLSLEAIYDMEPAEVGDLVKMRTMGKTILDYVSQFPTLELEVQAQPITRGVIRVQLGIIATFDWNKRFHGETEPWWIWVEDNQNELVYHHEYFILKREDKSERLQVNFTIPVSQGSNAPTQYIIRIVSDRWVGAEHTAVINVKDIIMPDSLTPHTELLNLEPLPITALKNPEYEKLYKITHYNPVQTQVFHTLYHTDNNALIGAPTGSGKTIMSEMAMFRLFSKRPGAKVIYIAPLKALVRERIEEWQNKFVNQLGKKLVELTGDYTPDVKLLKQADIIVCTPEKWDGISRNWQQRSYVRDVGLVVMDEIHLLGSDRGPILEVIVSRMRYIAWNTGQPIRMLGLSTSTANARDLADWLGIEKKGLYNFKPSVRPVPLTAYIQGFPGVHYCPRMATMNKPAYSAILQYSKSKPVLIFVSSRRQTRLTALDLISYCAVDENQQRFVRMPAAELEAVISQVKDQSLKHTLVFGIGIHHAGLNASDKAIVEELFVTNKIQVLVCTSTLAWGVNFPAHLVIIKGTEFFDPKTRKYVDYPITDVLQMMGRAGRPQFDNEGKAVIFVQDTKKYFYKKFLYEPFPVESSLAGTLHDHINAEIVSGTITSRQDAVDYLTWTFLFRRLVQNPSYYGIEDSSYESLNKWLSKLITSITEDLQYAGMCKIFSDEEKQDKLQPTSLATISSYYYLSHKTAANFARNVTEDTDIKALLTLVSDAHEYTELPVRHNEDKLNVQLQGAVPMSVESYNMESPHVKTNLLLQAHFTRVALPISDYITDTKTVLDQTVRIIQAYVDIAAEKAYLSATLNLMQFMQMVSQGRWIHDSTFLQLPHMDSVILKYLKENGFHTLPQLMDEPEHRIRSIFSKFLPANKVDKISKILKERLPRVNVTASAKVEQEAPQATILVHLDRVSRVPEKAYLPPEFPKQKDEGYWVVVGDLSKGKQIEGSKNRTGELVAMKRVHLPKQTTVELKVPKPSTGTVYTVFFMSDSYIGLDQVYDVQL